MNFHDLQQRLLDQARRRVRNGALTERGLARLSGVSQPHIHNSLKNIRSLSIPAADRLMSSMNLSIGDLLSASPNPSAALPDEDFTFTPIPFLHSRIGPGAQPQFDVFRGFFPVMTSLASGIVQPVAARLAPDLVLPRACGPGDIVLLDQNPTSRSRPLSGVWIIAEDGAGMRVRYARLVNARLFVFHEANVSEPAKWSSILLAGRNILDIVKARLVSIHREMEKDESGPPEPPG